MTQTNVGWMLDFPRLAAGVTDIGAPLSHAAIVARELGIPRWWVAVTRLCDSKLATAFAWMGDAAEWNFSTPERS